MRTFLEKCDCLKATLLLEVVATVKSKQQPESFLPAWYVSFGVSQQQSFSRVLILKRGKRFNTWNASHPLGSKCNVHIVGLLHYGDQCRCVDILTSKLELSEIVSSWHCTRLWLHKTHSTTLPRFLICTAAEDRCQIYNIFFYWSLTKF